MLTTLKGCSRWRAFNKSQCLTTSASWRCTSCRQLCQLLI